jgi:hypothetical protein
MSERAKRSVPEPEEPHIQKDLGDDFNVGGDLRRADTCYARSLQSLERIADSYRARSAASESLESVRSRQ